MRIEFVLGTQTVTGIDVGSVDNVFEIRIFDAQHNDITEYYDVEYVYGKLSVIKRTVNVYAKSANKEYDGTPLVAPGIAEDGVDGLVDGHSYDESELYSMGFLLGVGTVENQLAGRIIILDADGVDVTANYDPVLVSGVLTVTWTTIEISMYGGEATYTGEAVYSTKAKVTDGALADGDRIIFVRNGGFVDVGTHTGNYVVIAVIKTKLGYLIYEADAQGAYERVDPTKDMYVYLRHTDAYLKISVNDEVSLYYDVPKDNNYRISEYGIVYGINGPASPKPYTINPIKIVIQCDSESKSQSYFSSSERVAVTGGYTIAEGKLLDGHYIRAYTEGEATPSNPEAVNTIDASTIRFYSDKSLSVDSEITDEVKDCYVIEIIDGTLTLTP